LLGLIYELKLSRNDCALETHDVHQSNIDWPHRRGVHNYHPMFVHISLKSILIVHYNIFIVIFFKYILMVCKKFYYSFFFFLFLDHAAEVHNVEHQQGTIFIFNNEDT